MALSEQQLITWSRPVSTTEDQKCKNIVSQVTTAMQEKFGNAVKIFLQGSYENNTNIKQDSDVDIVVCYEGMYFPDLDWLNVDQKAAYYLQHPNSIYTFSEFKTDVLNKLNEKFGNAERKNKCVFIPGNTYRVNADVVACCPSKRYTDLNTIDAIGISFDTETGIRVKSFPHQHYTKGVTKTNVTSRMYKRIVRILKRLRNELIDSNAITENLVSSFFIECLVYNVPNNFFVSNNYQTTLRNVITKVHDDMGDAETADNYEEVSGLQWLFRGGGRKPADARLFMLNCWQYAGFN